LRYRLADDGILLGKSTEAGDEPFAAFCEWKSETDDKACGDCRRRFSVGGCRP
jgi:hypothetical protein